MTIEEQIKKAICEHETTFANYGRLASLLFLLLLVANDLLILYIVRL